MLSEHLLAQQAQLNSDNNNIIIRIENQNSLNHVLKPNTEGLGGRLFNCCFCKIRVTITSIIYEIKQNSKLDSIFIMK